MSQKLQIDHALEIIANAFHPLEVAVNAQDYNEKFAELCSSRTKLNFVPSTAMSPTAK